MAEATYRPFAADQPSVRLIVRRVPPNPGRQLALFSEFAYHPFITDRYGEMLGLEADHRRHAEVENAIRDLKYGVGLNRMPSGRFGANAAWLALNVMAHNLARWTSRIGMGETLITQRHTAPALPQGARTPHPLGSAPHPAPASPLALGEAVQCIAGNLRAVVLVT